MIQARIISFIFVFFIIFSKSFAEGNLDFETVIKEAKEFKKTGQVFFNFESVDLRLLTHFIAEITDKNIVLGTDIKGKVSLVFSKPLTIEQAWDIYTSILKSRNYAVVDKGEYVEVIPITAYRNTIPPIDISEKNSEELITFVYQIKNGDIVQISNIIRGLKSQKGLVYSYNPANILIITDTASNIKNLRNILSLIDSKDSGKVIKIYKLKYSNSQDIASAINVIFSEYSKRGILIKTFNIKSQNTVLVSAPKEVISQIDIIVNQLDVPFESINQRRFWTIYLKNAKAKDLANVLNKLLENINLVSFNSTKSLKGKNALKRQMLRPVSSKDKPKVIAEETSNAIIVYANKLEFEAIRDIVKSLDIQKKQILISALIVEVSHSTLKELGVRWQIFGSKGGVSFKGGISDSGFYSLFSQSNLVAGVLSSSGKTINIGGSPVFFPELLFMFSLLEKGSGFNVVSSPKILAMDNKEAKINVSQVIPYAESVKYDVNGNPIVNYDYKEVGLILKVIPHISGKSIIMELHQEVNDIIGFESANVGNLSYIVPRTSKREIDTTITVENGKTIVLGGLISKRTVKTIEGVPLLSEIPILGNLFKYQSDNNDKTNLFVFITPYVINSPEELAKITEEHMKLVKKLQKIKKKKENKKLKPKEEIKKSKDIFEEYRSYFGG